MCSLAHHLLACVYMCRLSIWVGKIRKTFNCASDKKSTIIPALQILCSTSSITKYAWCVCGRLGIVLMFGWEWDEEKRTKNDLRRQKVVHICTYTWVTTTMENEKREQSYRSGQISIKSFPLALMSFNAWNFLLVFNFPEFLLPEHMRDAHVCMSV